jgi:hypothetical protein
VFRDRSVAAKPALRKYLLASAVTLLVTGLVFVVLTSVGFAIGVLVSGDMTREEFFDRAAWWIALLIGPIMAAVYLVAIRELSYWFANQRPAWTDALVALAVTLVGVVLLDLTAVGATLLTAVIGGVLVALYLYWRAAARFAPVGPERGAA